MVSSAESDASSNSSALDQAVADFERISKLTVRRQVAARSLTTMAVGGALPYLIEPGSIEEAQRVISGLREVGLTWSVLGAGSNVILPDEPLDRVVVRLSRNLRNIERSGADLFTCGAAVALMNLSRSVSEDGYSGLEFAGGIPAAVGGAVFMNAGAHGGEIVDVLDEIALISSDGQLERISPRQFAFSYRHSGIPARSLIVEVTLKLAVSDRAATCARRQQCLAERKARQPLTLPSSGSVFKNPSADQPAGLLIERAGLKGMQRGGARISEKHANWIVNPERSATAAEVKALMQLCRDEVRERFALELEAEVQCW